MLLLHFPSVIQAMYVFAACIGGYWLYWEYTTGRRRRQLIGEHGCRSVSRVKTKDPILGLDVFFNSFRWSGQNTLLENWDRMLFGSGKKTVELNFLRNMSIFSTEAENVKKVLSLNFKVFGIPNRPKEIDLLIGDGIFTNEGKAWHQSRELLRPSFTRSQIADMGMLEKHVSALLKEIPHAGATVDLSKFFSQFTLSAATEFVFGEDGKQSDGDTQMTSRRAFTEVWNRISVFFVNEGRSGKQWLWHSLLDRLRMNPGYKRDCKTLHGKYNIDQIMKLFHEPSATRGILLTKPRQKSWSTWSNDPSQPNHPPPNPRKCTLSIPPGTRLPDHRQTSYTQRSPQRPLRRQRHHRRSPDERLVRALQATRHLCSSAPRDRHLARSKAQLRAIEGLEVPPRRAEREPEVIPHRPGDRATSTRRHRLAGWRRRRWEESYLD